MLEDIIERKTFKLISSSVRKTNKKNLDKALVSSEKNPLRNISLHDSLTIHNLILGGAIKSMSANSKVIYVL
jgi:hypothetical protein